MSNMEHDEADSTSTPDSTPDWVESTDLRSLLARDSDLEVVATIRRDSMEPAGTYVSDPDEFPLRATVEQFLGPARQVDDVWLWDVRSLPVR